MHPVMHFRQSLKLETLKGLIRMCAWFKYKRSGIETSQTFLSGLSFHCRLKPPKCFPKWLCWIVLHDVIFFIIIEPWFKSCSLLCHHIFSVKKSWSQRHRTHDIVGWFVRFWRKRSADSRSKTLGLGCRTENRGGRVECHWNKWSSGSRRGARRRRWDRGSRSEPIQYLGSFLLIVN